MSWLENLKNVKRDKNVSNRWIAEHSSVPQKTVDRIFAGDTDSPKFDTIRLVCEALGVSIDDIATDTMTVLGSKTQATLQAENDQLAAELAELMDKLVALETELSAHKDTIAALTAENDILRLKLEHKEEIIAIHNYYISKERKN